MGPKKTAASRAGSAANRSKSAGSPKKTAPSTKRPVNEKATTRSSAPDATQGSEPADRRQSSAQPAERCVRPDYGPPDSGHSASEEADAAPDKAQSKSKIPPLPTVPLARNKFVPGDHDPAAFLSVSELKKQIITNARVDMPRDNGPTGGIPEWEIAVFRTDPGPLTPKGVAIHATLCFNWFSIDPPGRRLGTTHEITVGPCPTLRQAHSELLERVMDCSSSVPDDGNWYSSGLADAARKLRHRSIPVWRQAGSGKNYASDMPGKFDWAAPEAVGLSDPTWRGRSWSPRQTRSAAKSAGAQAPEPAASRGKKRKADAVEAIEVDINAPRKLRSTRD